MNGRTIAYEKRKTVDYWHIELDEHDVVLAAGLPCESYLDTGNRIALVNGTGFRELSSEPKDWRATCLPYANSGPVVDNAKAVLRARAEILSPSLTDDPDLHVVADGRRIDGLRLGKTRHLFVLPAQRQSATLRSRTFIPANVFADNGDDRELGVSIARLQVDGDDIPLGGTLGAGWHAPERRGDLVWRWTKGDASLPGKCRAVMVDLGGLGRYRDEPEAPRLSIVA